MNRIEKNRKWNKDPSYRVNVIRELEGEGVIQRLPKHDFNFIVRGF